MSVRVEVTDEHGTAAELIDADAVAGRRDRAAIAALADGLVRRAAGILGSGEDHARLAVIADLTRLLADEKAYERVAERRGLLPL